MSQEKIKFIRICNTSIKSLWDLWTTNKGFESWFGPIGFRTEVASIDFSEGGELKWTMIVENEEIKAFLIKEGQSLRTDHVFVFTKIDYPNSFTYRAKIDFLENVAPYDNEVTVSFVETEIGSQMTINIDAMHDEMWTERAKAGWQSQITKLDGIFV